MLIARQTRPWSLLDQFNRELSQVFDQDYHEKALKHYDWHPAVDIKETDHSFELAVDLPGIKPENIEVTAKDGIISISGTRKSETEQKDASGKCLKSERFFGQFYREFKLPDTADEESIQAKSEHGELLLTIPKKAKTQAKRIEIK